MKVRMGKFLQAIAVAITAQALLGSGRLRVVQSSVVLVDCSNDILRMLLQGRFTEVIIDLTLSFLSIRSVFLLLADLIDRSLDPALSILAVIQRGLIWLHFHDLYPFVQRENAATPRAFR
jgi:hypothetical protein